MAALHFVGGWAPPPATALVLLRPARLSKTSLHLPSTWASSRTRMGLKIVRTYDSSFELKPECEEKLHSLLSSATFRTQVAEQLVQQPETNANGSEYEFTGELFQPVPWSVTTRHGMPQEFEKYFNNPEYAIVNVPPNFMFQAKIFKPSRLCAVFRKTAIALSEV